MLVVSCHQTSWDKNKKYTISTEHEDSISGQNETLVCSTVIFYIWEKFLSYKRQYNHYDPLTFIISPLCIYIIPNTILWCMCSTFQWSDKNILSSSEKLYFHFVIHQFSLSDVDLGSVASRYQALDLLANWPGAVFDRGVTHCTVSSPADQNTNRLWETNLYLHSTPLHSAPLY